MTGISEWEAGRQDAVVDCAWVGKASRRGNIGVKLRGNAFEQRPERCEALTPRSEDKCTRQRDKQGPEQVDSPQSGCGQGTVSGKECNTRSRKEAGAR